MTITRRLTYLISVILFIIAVSPVGAGSGWWPSMWQNGGSASASWGLGSANQVRLQGFFLPSPTTFSKILVRVVTADAGAGVYDVGIYDTNGTLVANWGATALGSTGGVDKAIAQGATTIAAGKYAFAFTGNAAVAAIYVGGSQFQFIANVLVAQSSSGGNLPAAVTFPADNWTVSGNPPYFVLHN